MGSIIWILTLCLASVSAATNRTSCFQYIDCYEKAQINLKDCAGGTGIALTLESKDRTLAQLFAEQSNVINGCQDHLMKEIIDFDALQVLVTQDSRECFEKLPENTRPINSGNCEFTPTPVRDHYGKDKYQCATEYLEDRKQCETLLRCCPDHSRCGERINAISLAYQQASAKSLQIVSNLLSCVVSREPSTHELVSHLKHQRSALRNAGLPFFKPDLATEERINRRLTLTSTVTQNQRQKKFVQRYHEIRNALVVRIAKETSPKPETTTAPASKDRRVNMIKNLLKNADDQDLAIYVSLISDGNFEKLSELEKEKLLKIGDENEAQNAIEKIGVLKNAITKAISNKEHKTIEYAIKSQISREAAAELEEDENEWNDRREKEAVNEVLGEALEGVESDILFRAKKFASAVGEAIEAQKELVLSKDSTFQGNGLRQQRTSAVASPDEGAMVHDYSILKDKHDEPASFIKQTSLALADIQPLTQAKLVNVIQTPIQEKEEVVEGSGSEEVEGSGSEEVIDVKPNVDIEPSILSEDELLTPSVKEEAPKESQNTSSESHKHDGKKHHYHKHHHHHHHHHHNSTETSTSAKEDRITTTTVVPVSTVETVATEPTTLLPASTVPSEEQSFTSSTVPTTSSTAVTTTIETVTEEKTENERKPRGDEQISESISNKDEAKEELTAFNKDQQEFREKIVNLKRKLAKIDAVSQEAAKLKKDESKKEDNNVLSNIVNTMTDNLNTKTVNVDSSTDEGLSTTTKIPSESLPNFCSEYAKCDDLAHEYENQCHERYTESYMTHHIEESTIVNILYNNSISKHEIVMKACLRPLDKNSYSNLKQLLTVQRGVRRACLDLGRNRGAISSEVLAQCQSTQSNIDIDAFLNNHKLRSEENRITCLAKVEAFRDSCNNVSRCCASIAPCDKYINQSPLQKLKEEAISTLVQRQNACEERMMETLKYIHDNLTSRRRRFYMN